MSFFPYNAMYSVDFYRNNSGETYALKLNNQLLHITRNWYWKKDFLETSLRGFAHYIEDSNRVFMDHYLDYKFPNPAIHGYLREKLTPGIIKRNDWVKWYASFAGNDKISGDTIVLIKYAYQISNSGFQLTDSSIIWKTILDAGK